MVPMLLYRSDREDENMSQMTIYLEEKEMRDIRLSAKRENISVSRWARNRLCEAVHHAWPRGYFDLFGTLAESDLSRPPQADLGVDAERGGL